MEEVRKEELIKSKKILSINVTCYIGESGGSSCASAATKREGLRQAKTVIVKQFRLQCGGRVAYFESDQIHEFRNAYGLCTTESSLIFFWNERAYITVWWSHRRWRFVATHNAFSQTVSSLLVDFSIWNVHVLKKLSLSLSRKGFRCTFRPALPNSACQILFYKRRTLRSKWR